MALTELHRIKAADRIKRINQKLATMKLEIKHGKYPKVVDKRGSWHKGKKRVIKLGKWKMENEK